MAGAVFLAAFYAAVSTIGVQSPGPIDKTAAQRLRKLCGSRTDCQVHLGDIVDGDWDTFFEFGAYDDQEQVNDVLGVHDIHVSDLQRLLVFEKNGRIVRTEHADFGVERPFDDELVFEDEFISRRPTWVRYAPSDRFQVTACETPKNGKLRRPGSGNYYLLTALPLRYDDSRQCQPMP